MMQRQVRAGAFVLAVLVGCVTLVACDSLLGPGESGPPEKITELPRALTGAEVEAIAASNAFGLDLLREVARTHPSSSVFLSPLSASMALGMGLNGAAGSTFDAMRTTLRFDGLSEEEINDSFAGLLELLRELDPVVEMAVGNAVWYRQGLELDEGFAERVRAWFSAAVESVDFTDAGTAEAMNTWASEATDGRIERVAGPTLDPDLAVVIMNAVYFKASWTRGFDPENTREAPFHLPDGSADPIELMRQTEVFPHYDGQRYVAVELPYGGEAFAMTVVVPRKDEGVSIHDVVEELDAEIWSSLVGDLHPRLVSVELPRFQLEWNGILNGHLAAMGMDEALRPGADFSRMFRSSAPWLDEVRQQTFVRVDEVGTEAAAVTIGNVVDATPLVRADRPFLLAIRERLSGAILFLGVVVEPPRL